MPSINDMIKNLGSKSDRSELKDMALRLKLQIEDGTMSIEEARKELQRFKDNQSYRASKGMADGGDVKKGIGSFLPRMSNGGILNSHSNININGYEGKHVMEQVAKLFNNIVAFLEAIKIDREKVRPVSDTLGASLQNHRSDFRDCFHNPSKMIDKVSFFE